MRFPSILARVGRQALILPPVLIGAAVLFAVVARRNTPQQQAIPEASRPLRVITVPRTAVVPRVLGFGTARPGDIWSAVAEVKGRITETHPELKAGAIIRQGETVVRIDPAEYDLQIAQTQSRDRPSRSPTSRARRERRQLQRRAGHRTGSAPRGASAS